MNKETPPFEIGQEVVAVINTPQLQKNKKYVIADVRKTCGCYWDISVGILTNFETCRCPDCNKQNIPTNGYQWHRHTRFAPIEPMYEKSLSKELANEAMKNNIEIDIVKQLQPIEN